MESKTQSPLDRLKQTPLWKWGLISIFSGLMINMLTMVARPKGRLSPEEAASVYGALAGTSLVIVAGIVMIIMHFLRRKKNGLRRKKNGGKAQ